MTQRFAAQCRIECEDVVRKPPSESRKELFGVVEKIGGQGSDSDTDSDESDVPEGMCRVRWRKSLSVVRRSKVRLSNLELVDRSLGPGNIVSAYDDTQQRMGIVTELNVVVDVSVPSCGHTFEEVDAREITRLHPFAADILVAVDVQWDGTTPPQFSPERTALASVARCACDLILRFKDGSCCLLEDPPADGLLSEDAYDAVEDQAYPYWPGQVIPEPGRQFAKATYLAGAWKKQHREGVVERLIPTALHLTLVTCPQDELSQLSAVVASGSRTRLVAHPAAVRPFVELHYGRFNLGDTAVVPVNFREHTAAGRRLALDILGPRFPLRRADAAHSVTTEAKVAHYTALELAAPVADPGTGIGYISNIRTFCAVHWQDGETQSELPSIKLFTRAHVQDFDLFPSNLVQRAPAQGPGSRKGVVQWMDAAKRLCDVQWLHLCEEDPQPEVEKGISAYDLCHAIPEEIEAGDVVILPHAADRDRCFLALHPTDPDTDQMLLPTKIAAAPPTAPGVVAVGQVLRKRADGDLDILWLDGSRGSASQWHVIPVPEDDGDMDDDSDDEEEEDADEADEEVSENLAHKEKEVVEDQPNSTEPEPSHTTAADDEAAASAFVLSSEVQFVEGFVAHHFGDREQRGNPQRQFLQRVRREWSVLQSSLPPRGVLIKASSSDARLMKVLVCGCPFTPYYRGIYAFDFFLTDTFPDEPPKVFFHHFGVQRLNPNLSPKDGGVCLSLLGTWHSPNPQEQWSRDCTLLQLVLSLQAIVLSGEPYYNEGSWDYRHVGADMNSKSYNEQVLLSKVRHLIEMALHPPADWENEVREHCRGVLAPMIAALESPTLGEPRPGARQATCDEEGLFGPPSEGMRASLHSALLRAREVAAQLQLA
eukprot:TRINITY_DN20837_c0_g1_i1.p1 TRINITY_DN20837_c0_g1~~TRINITY_DN20837_c0_g1_i1.p1  ORF type:complete len:889 (+),score=149.55 TRINITY_DN20837_c0_g1_i1:28-2667(+)